jgi:DNA-binding XRE family transcriptional regulator
VSVHAIHSFSGTIVGCLNLLEEYNPNCPRFAGKPLLTAPCSGLEKSNFSDLSAIFRKKLVALREAAGLTQRGLAKRIGRERSFVSRIEQGERRVDLIEFYWICRAVGVQPEKATIELLKQFTAADRKPSRLR